MEKYAAGYVQMTLDDWMAMKEELAKDLIGVGESFVRIGYKLRRIKDEKLYERDGYATITDFAQKEYGLSASMTSRFMAINEKYSIDGYSDKLRIEFANIGSSKLSEMLALPDSDLSMIRPETTREQIRELKTFNKQGPVNGIADDLREAITCFIADNSDAIAEAKPHMISGNMRKVKEAICPSGSRMYKKGLYALMMYETVIKVKRFGQDPKEITWEEFSGIILSAIEEAEKVPEIIDEQIPGQDRIENHPEFMPAPVQEPEKIAPAQKVEKTEEQKYAEDQKKIDRETKKKMEAAEDEKKMQTLPSDRKGPKAIFRAAPTAIEEFLSGDRTFDLVKEGEQIFRKGDRIEHLEMKDGRNTGRVLKSTVVYVMRQLEGLKDGYTVIGLRIENREDFG